MPYALIVALQIFVICGWGTLHQIVILNQFRPIIYESPPPPPNTQDRSFSECIYNKFFTCDPIENFLLLKIADR